MASDGSQHIRLPDGRRLEMQVSGPADGLPLIFHHGTPGAVTPVRAMARAAHGRDLRLVTTSRPGYGQSDRLAGRDVAAVADDTRAVLAELGASRCLIAGWSGGGPHALACGALLGDLAAGVLVIAGVAPFDAAGLDWMAGMGEENVTEFTAVLGGESTLRPYLDGVREHLREITPTAIISALDSLLPDVDRAALSGEFAEDMAAGFRAAISPGVDGWLDDDLAFCHPWGFELTDVRVPVLIWQGSEDLMVPFAHGQWLATHVPGAAAHLEQGEGHLSVGIGSLDRMLDELTGTADRA